VRSVPLFDTNIFGDAQSGKIPPSEWKYLLRHRPGHGWPLSIVTLLELLVDLDNVGEARFSELKRRLDLADQLCKGRVADEARVLICRDLLRIPFPTELIPPPKQGLVNYMQLRTYCKRFLTGAFESRVAGLDSRPRMHRRTSSGT